MAEDKWTADSNECIEVVLTRGGEAGPSFNPTFTHTIFEEETIFGFSDLAISLYCGAASLRQCLDIQYDKKHNKADDLESALTAFLAPDVSRDVDEYMRSILDTEASFTPPGTLVASYTVDKKGKSKRTIPDIVDGQISNAENTVYEAYAADWHTDGWTDWHRRMQVFNRLLIDGASDIDEQDPSWSFIALFERSKSRYSFVGFVSLFAFFYYSPSLHERRQKLAQFFILPPFQGHGHGGQSLSSSATHFPFTYRSSRKPRCTPSVEGKRSQTMSWPNSQSKTRQKRSKTCATSATSPCSMTTPNSAAPLFQTRKQTSKNSGAVSNLRVYVHYFSCIGSEANRGRGGDSANFTGCSR